MNVVVITSGRMPDAMDNGLLANRSKLLKLAENIKTRKKPTAKKTLSLREDPSYTNIEHLVFGTYRSRPSFPLSPDGKAPSTSNGTADGSCNSNKVLPIVERAEENSADRGRLTEYPSTSAETASSRNGTYSPRDEPTNGNVEAIADEADSSSRRQRSAVCRSRQKPPVHLNGNRSSPPRTSTVPRSSNRNQQSAAIGDSEEESRRNNNAARSGLQSRRTLSDGRALEPTNGERVTIVSNGHTNTLPSRINNKIVVRVSHGEDGANGNAPTPKTNRHRIEAVSGASSREAISSITNRQSSIPPSSRTKPKSRDQTAQHARSQSQSVSQKPAPQVATNRSAALRKSALSTAAAITVPTVKSHSQKPSRQSLIKNDGFPRPSSIKSTASSRNGSLSNSRNSLCSSRGSLNSVSSKSTSSTAKVTKNKTVVRVNAKPALKVAEPKSGHSRTVVQRSTSKVSRPTVAPPALPPKTTASKRANVSNGVRISSTNKNEVSTTPSNKSKATDLPPTNLSTEKALIGREINADDITSKESNDETKTELAETTDPVDAYCQNPSPKKKSPTKEADRNAIPPSPPLALDSEDGVSYIKSLPSRGNSTADNNATEMNYVLERPNKPLYTWYDTRRRGMQFSPPPLKLPPRVDEIDRRDACCEEIPSRGNRLTTSLPKSFITSRFTALSTLKTPSEFENVFARERRDSEPVITSTDKYDEISSRSSDVSVADEIRNAVDANHVSLSVDHSLNGDVESAIPSSTTPSSPSSSNVSRCGRPHGSTGCLRCSDGGRLAMELRLLHRDRTMPKCVRRVKASSSPPAFAMSSTDLSVSESDLRRPWSQVYSEAEAQRVLDAKSRVLESVTVPNSTSSSCADLSLPRPTSPCSPPSTARCKMLLPQMSMPSMFSSRCSSLRAPATARVSANAMDSVLQKFRKSFSLRFQRHRRSPSPSTPATTTKQASTTQSATDGEAVQSSNNNDLDALQTQPSDDVQCARDDDNTLFRFGPIVWRSSKEKKNKNKKEAKSGNKCCSPDSGIHVEAVTNQSDLKPVTTTSTTSNSSSPGTTPCRGISATFRVECQRKSLSNALSCASVDDDLENCTRALKRRTRSDVGSCEAMQIASRNNYESPPVHRKSLGDKHRGQCKKLRRSVSQPLEMDKVSSVLSLARYPGGHSDHEGSTRSLYASSDDGDAPSSDGDSPTRGRHKAHRLRHRQGWGEYVTYAEALWNHVTMDPDELPFKAGDLVAVLNCSDRNWWWGALQDRMGWFPAEFVRPRISQSNETNNVGGDQSEYVNSKSVKNSAQMVNNNQIRTNVIKEIVTTERDFVQHLKDVIEGYLKQTRKRPDMFPEERVNTIFGNMEQIYAFQSLFLSKLEECINWETPHLSCLGSCFVQNRAGFQVYSEYCNNHPQAVSELQEMLAIPKYSHFFEACRLLQDMIDISLDGFLLTPVQKICKYPLQLAELLKFTSVDHPDRAHVAEALQTMRQVAHDINERKRRMECLEKLAAWQLSVEIWEGSDLLDHSSELIHSSDVTKVTSSWSRDLTLFLFDHQLIMCKRDLLKRNTFCYKGRICTDQSEIIDLPDGRDAQSGLIVRHAWKIYCGSRSKWFTFCSKTTEEKMRWMKAFQEERNRVEEDEQRGFVVSDRAKLTAMSVVKNKLKRNKSKHGKEPFSGRRMTRTNASRRQLEVASIKAKTGSLPHGIILSTCKKKNATGWFAFGSNNKKQKR